MPPTPPYGPLRQRAEAEADLRYRAPILQAQALPVNAGNWFDQYIKSVQAAGQSVGARYAGAAQQNFAPTIGPAVQTAEGDQAAASRGVVNQAFANLLQTQGNAQQDYFAGRETVGAAQKLQTQQQAAVLLAELTGKRGTWVQTRLAELKDEAWRKRLEAAGFNLDAYEAGQKAKAEKRSARLERRKARLDAKPTPSERKTEADLAFFRKHGYYPPTGPPKTGAGADGKSRFTPLQQRDAKEKIRKAYQTVKKNDPGPGNKDYWKSIYDAMTDAGVDPLIARVAIQSYRGNIRPSVAKALFNNYGVKVKPRPGKRPKDTDFGADDYSKGEGRPD